MAHISADPCQILNKNATKSNDLAVVVMNRQQENQPDHSMSESEETLAATNDDITINVRHFFDISSSQSTCRICYETLFSTSRKYIEYHFYSIHKSMLFCKNFINRLNILNFYRIDSSNCKICNKHKQVKMSNFEQLKNHLLRKHFFKREPLFNDEEINSFDLRDFLYVGGPTIDKTITCTCRICFAFFRGENKYTFRRHLRTVHMKTASSNRLEIDDDDDNAPKGTVVDTEITGKLKGDCLNLFMEHETTMCQNNVRIFFDINPDKIVCRICNKKLSHKIGGDYELNYHVSTEHQHEIDMGTVINPNNIKNFYEFTGNESKCKICEKYFQKTQFRVMNIHLMTNHVSPHKFLKMADKKRSEKLALNIDEKVKDNIKYFFDGATCRICNKNMSRSGNNKIQHFSMVHLSDILNVDIINKNNIDNFYVLSGEKTKCRICRKLLIWETFAHKKRHLFIKHPTGFEQKFYKDEIEKIDLDRIFNMHKTSMSCSCKICHQIILEAFTFNMKHHLTEKHCRKMDDDSADDDTDNSTSTAPPSSSILLSTSTMNMNHAVCGEQSNFF